MCWSLSLHYDKNTFASNALRKVSRSVGARTLASRCLFYTCYLDSVCLFVCSKKNSHSGHGCDHYDMIFFPPIRKKRKLLILAKTIRLQIIGNKSCTLLWTGHRLAHKSVDLTRFTAEKLSVRSELLRPRSGRPSEDNGLFRKFRLDNASKINS